MTASAAVVAVVRRIIEGPRLATREELAEESALLRDERVGCEVRAATTRLRMAHPPAMQRVMRPSVMQTGGTLTFPHGSALCQPPHANH